MIQSLYRQKLVGLLIVTVVFLFISVNVTTQLRAINEQKERPEAAPSFISAGPTNLLCDYGVNVIQSIQNIDMGALGAGWYLDYNAKDNPARPNGIEYVVTVRLTQVGSDNYTYHLFGGTSITTVAAGSPGAIWLIGNEPDRRIWQDDIEPHVYAKAYHDLYYLIKAADPTARIFAGTIVQPTPIRLQYLDMILENYIERYNTTMPVDGWSIHNFILNEVSCEYNINNCWGAEIPPGINAPYGEIVAIEDNGNIDMFKQRIVNFRQWMKNRGYGNLPLTVSEYGILMPADFGFPPATVNQYITDSFNYMRSTTDPNLGDPNDNFKLVQTWSWFSSGATGDLYNGYLFEDTGGGNWELSEMGEHFSSYVSGVPEEVDFYPSQVFAEPAFSNGAPVTMTLKTRIANGGNSVPPQGPTTVRFYLGDPNNGGTQIGSDFVVSLAGCGRNIVLEQTWPNVAPGAYEIFVVVDAGSIVETDTTNNIASAFVLVATEKIHLPITYRQLSVSQ